jgi:hypothetical protein
MAVLETKRAVSLLLTPTFVMYGEWVLASPRICRGWWLAAFVWYDAVCIRQAWRNDVNKFSRWPTFILLPPKFSRSLDWLREIAMLRWMCWVAWWATNVTSAERNVSGEGHLKGKIPPPKKRIRGFGYRFYMVFP